MNCIKAKIICAVSAVLVALGAVVLASCGLDGRGSITINLPPIESRARAIAPERLEDLKGSTESYRVAVEANGQREEKSGKARSYSFTVPLGAVATITLECLNADGEVIVRAVKTHKVYAGINNVDIKLSQDGEEVPVTPPAPAVTLEQISVSSASLEFENSDVAGKSEAEVVTLIKDKITVTASYSDKSTREVTDYTVSTLDTNNTTAPQTVTITYEGKTTTMTITVLPPLASTPTVGSIIMKDGTLCDANSVMGRENDAIAVVYKVENGKAWAVGKVLSSTSMKWADSSANGYSKNIRRLQEENGYTDGSTGLSILRAAVSDADDANLATNYPAWDYACNYGTNQNLKNFQTGWYLPSKQELQEVYDNKAAIEAALAQTGVSKTSFGSPYYWSSSQYASVDFYACDLNFGSGSWGTGDSKPNSSYVCAVRQFTW